MKLYCDKDEYWPVFDVSEDRRWYGRVIELTEDDLADLRRVEGEWRAWQSRLLPLYEGGEDARTPEELAELTERVAVEAINNILENNQLMTKIWRNE